MSYPDRIFDSLEFDMNKAIDNSKSKSNWLQEDRWLITYYTKARFRMHNDIAKIDWASQLRCQT